MAPDNGAEGGPAKPSPGFLAQPRRPFERSLIADVMPQATMHSIHWGVGKGVSYDSSTTAVHVERMASNT